VNYFVDIVKTVHKVNSIDTGWHSTNGLEFPVFFFRKTPNSRVWRIRRKSIRPIRRTIDVKAGYGRSYPFSELHMFDEEKKVPKT